MKFQKADQATNLFYFDFPYFGKAFPKIPETCQIKVDIFKVFVFHLGPFLFPEEKIQWIVFCIVWVQVVFRSSNHWVLRVIGFFDGIAELYSLFIQGLCLFYDAKTIRIVINYGPSC